MPTENRSPLPHSFRLLQRAIRLIPRSVHLALIRATARLATRWDKN